MTLKDNAKYLRSHMTVAESRLWYYLRGNRLLGLKFKRQNPLALISLILFVWISD